MGRAGVGRAGVGRGSTPRVHNLAHLVALRADDTRPLQPPPRGLLGAQLRLKPFCLAHRTLVRRLLRLRQQHHAHALTLATRSSKALHEAHGRSDGIKANDQVDIPDIEALLGHRRRDQHVVRAGAELGQRALLVCLAHTCRK